MYRPFSKATWCIYLFLLSIRTLIAFSPGYIHPDEYFQSAEVTAGNPTLSLFQLSLRTAFLMKVGVV